MILESLAQLYRRVELLSLMGADIELFTRWSAARRDAILSNLLRYCRDAQVAESMSAYASSLVEQVDDLIRSQQVNVAADMIPDLIESLCAVAQMRHAHAGGSPVVRREEAVRTNDGFTYAAAA